LSVAAVARDNSRAAALAAGGGVVVFVATAIILGSDNPLASFALPVAGVFFLLGIVKPRLMLLLMVPVTCYLDGAKRLLLLSGETQLEDVTSVLAIAPVAAAGIILGCVLQKVMLRKRGEPVERIALLASLGAFVAFGGTDMFATDDLLFGLRAAANSTVYFLLAWAVYHCYRTPEEIERFLRYCVLVAIPVALYGVWQSLTGLTQFEIDYLQSGLTMTASNLEDLRPRPFSTLSSPFAYGYVMAFMLLLAVHLWSAGIASARGWRHSWKGVAAISIFAVALMLGLGRSAIVSGVAMLVYGWLFRSKAGVSFAYLSSTAILAATVGYADTILNSLDTLQSYLPGGTAVWQEQAFRLGTFTERLVGYRGILGNPGSWPLFANPLRFGEVVNLLDRNDATFSHDLFSQTILRVGAVPMFFGVVVVAYFVWRAHRAILRLPPGTGGTRPLAAALMGAIIAFVYAQASVPGITVFPLNFWMGIFAGMLLVVCVPRRDSVRDGAAAITVPGSPGRSVWRGDPTARWATLPSRRPTRT
jgi:hypothetical protein